MGRKWSPMIPAIQILTLWGMIRSIGATAGPVYQAIGRPELITRILLAKLILLAVMIYPLAQKWGIYGVSWAVVLNGLMVNPVANYIVIRIIGCRIRDFVVVISIPLIAALLMSGALHLMKTFALEEVGVLSFLLLGLFGIGMFLGLIWIFDKYLDYGFYGMIVDRLSKLRKG